MIKYKYFDVRSRKKELIPGKTYIVNLPICLDFPCLREEKHTLIAHRSIPPLSGAATRWTVTHAGTGLSLSNAKTRKEAMKKTMEKLLSIGESNFLLAVDTTERSQSYNLVSGESIAPSVGMGPAGNKEDLK